MTYTTTSRQIIATVCPDVLGQRRQVGVVSNGAVTVCMHCCADLATSTTHRVIRQGEL